MIEKGEIVTLEEGKEYICFHTVSHGDKDYVLLMSNGKPLEVRYAFQTPDENGTKLTYVESAEERQLVFELFRGGNGDPQ